MVLPQDILGKNGIDSLEIKKPSGTTNTFIRAMERTWIMIDMPGAAVRVRYVGLTRTVSLESSLCV